MNIHDLLEEIDIIDGAVEGGDAWVTGIVCDSRKAHPGSLFVCIRGQKHDGHQFAAEAAARGARLVVAEAPLHLPPLDPAPTVLRVADTRLAYALLCSAYYGHPARTMKLTGVTGTNGKTTTTHLIDATYRAAGMRTGVVGTVWTRSGDDLAPSRLTTPEAGELQRTLASMREKGVEHCVVEVSSHALSLQRVAGLEFDVAVFTNLSRDHLDFHGSWTDYYLAKRRLFTMLRSDRPHAAAVVNTDDPWGRRLARELKAPVVVRYGMSPGADVRGAVAAASLSGVHMRVATPDGEFEAELPLPGMCNAYNGLAAAASAWAMGLPLDAIAAGLRALPQVPGRFQRVDRGQPFQVVVDFAHNPEGLRHALAAVAAGNRGEVWAVFGCKGEDGDSRKRRLMGVVAASLADRIILTNDDVYGEDPEAIIREVKEAILSAGFPEDRCLAVLDRREAMYTAFSQAREGDRVVVAGRGHEPKQTIGERELDFDDAEVAAEILGEIYGVGRLGGDPPYGGTVYGAVGRRE